MVKKLIFLIISATILVALYGCHAGGNAPKINAFDTQIVERNATVANGRFADITFPSGATIKCTADGTFQDGVKITADEEKIIVEYDYSTQAPVYYYLYKIYAVSPSSNALDGDVAVSTIEQPISISLPNDVSDSGNAFIGLRASEDEPWRYSLIEDSANANISTLRLAKRAGRTCTFNLFRLGSEFRLFVFDSFKDDEAVVTSVTTFTRNKITVEDGKYAEDLNLKVKVTGEKLDQLNTNNIIARITYRSIYLAPIELKANGSIVKQTDSSDKGVSGGFAHSFEVTNMKVESQMSGEALLSLVLNLNDIKLSDFPTRFLIEFYSKNDIEKTLPFAYTEVFAFETVEKQDDPKPKETYSINYDLDGGEPTGNNPTSYTEENEITLSNPKKSGYTFSGWTGSNGDTPQTSVTIVKGSTGTKEYIANWSLDVYEITYNKIDFCTFEKDNPTTYDITSASITLTNPTRTGCEFLGWTYEGQTTPTKTVKIEKGTTGNKEFTANFKLDLTLTIAQDEGAIIDEVNKLYYTKSTFTITPSMAAGAQMTDTEKANILSVLSVKDSENNSISDISADWNNDGNIALAFSKDLTASTTYTISFGDIDGVALTCNPFNFKTFYYKGKGTTQVPYQVENAAQLDLVRNYLSCHFKQTNDIDLSDISQWIAIGDDTTPFTGVYDGGNQDTTPKKIKNFKIQSDDTIENAGLFGFIQNDNGGQIKNITIDGISIRGATENDSLKVKNLGIIAVDLGKNCSITNCCLTDSSVDNATNSCSIISINNNILFFGGICCSNNGTISHCSVEKCNILSSADNSNSLYLGGICYDNLGNINNCCLNEVIINCSFDYIKDLEYIGGICSVNDYDGGLNGSLTSCHIKNSFISGSKDYNKLLFVGGICANHVSNEDISHCYIQNSRVKGNGGGAKIGGIVATGDGGKISSCHVKDGSLIEGTSTNCYIGGIAGSRVSVTGCDINDSTVIGDGSYCNIGGILGESDSETINNCHITNSKVIGTITNNNIGGICGYSSRQLSIHSCYVENSILNCYSKSDLGGICGRSFSESSISSCYIIGSTLTATDQYNYIGGIAGEVDNSISSCYVAETTINGSESNICHSLYSSGSVNSCFTDNTEALIKFDNGGSISNIYNSITSFSLFKTKAWSDGLSYDNANSVWNKYDFSQWPPKLKQN